MRITPSTAFFALTLLFAPPPAASDATTEAAAATAAETASPLEAMARLVGGAWAIGPVSHVFEFGVGRQSLHARTYDSKGTLVSEARWFWHPGEGVIRGYAVDAAGSALTEMTTAFDGDKMTNHLVVVNGEGRRSSYVGEWLFVGEDRYDWTLYADTGDGREKQFEATAARGPWPREAIAEP